MTKKHSALIVLVGRSTRFLMEWRSDYIPGGAWVFPGGRVEEGETYDAAVRRETTEEIGVTLTEIHALSPIPSRPPWINHPFVATTWEGVARKTTDAGDRLEWRTIPEAMASTWEPSRLIADMATDHLYFAGKLKTWANDIWEDVEIYDFDLALVSDRDGHIFPESGWPRCNWCGGVAVKKVTRKSLMSGFTYDDFACRLHAAGWENPNPQNWWKIAPKTP
jgi:8-oxo-dGTP pyrophosphatase MutT (NUDIX family)